MQSINIILHNCISWFDVEAVSPRLNIPTCKSEKPTPADDRHLPHLREDGVSSQNTESTAVILALHESKIQRHQQAHFLLPRRRIYSLSSSYQLGAGFGSHSQRIVHHKHVAERRHQRVAHGGLSDPHGGGVRVGDDVVEVEVEVTELLVLEANRFGRKVSGKTVGFPAGAGGRGVCGDGGEEYSEKDEGSSHSGEETKVEKAE